MNRLSRYVVILFLTIAVSACSGTVMKNSWIDPEFDRPIQKVYIVGISKEDSHRRLLEDALSQKLAENGIPAVASYHDLSGNRREDQNYIVKGMTDNGCDVVVLFKFSGIREDSITTPGTVYGTVPGFNYDYYPNSWWKYYIHGFRTVLEQPQVHTFKLALFETVMYDLFADQVFWGGQFESLVTEDVEKMVSDFVEEVRKGLERDKLI